MLPEYHLVVGGVDLVAVIRVGEIEESELVLSMLSEVELHEDCG
jgi:hypothetical protein